MTTVIAVGLGLLGASLAEALDAYRVYLAGDGPKATHRWPAALPFRNFASAAMIRLTIAALAVATLSALGAVCANAIAVVSGLATVKVVELFFGYVAGSSAVGGEGGGTT